MYAVRPRTVVEVLAADAICPEMAAAPAVDKLHRGECRIATDAHEIPAQHPGPASHAVTAARSLELLIEKIRAKSIIAPAGAAARFEGAVVALRAIAAAQADGAPTPSDEQRLYLIDRLSKLAIVMENTVQPLRVVGYLRVSTDEQVRSGLGLDAQTSAIRSEAQRRGWDIVDLISDPGVSGTKRHDQRPGFRRVLDLLESRAVDAVVVAKLDRLGRRLEHQCQILGLAERNGWGLIALDVDLDTTTAAGKLTANIMGAVNQHFRDVIAERTREALAEKKAQGVRLGRPRLVTTEIAARIQTQRISGATLQSVADRLNADGVTTPTGRAWTPATVRRVTLQTT